MTALDTWSTLHRQGALLEVMDDTLRCTAPPGVLTKELRQALHHHKEILTRALTHWQPPMLFLALWLEECHIPAVPFTLSPGRHVTDPARFFAALRADVYRGPAAPRSRYGALQEDLALLYCGMNGLSRALTLQPLRAVAMTTGIATQAMNRQRVHSR